jgi:hypothetical protein
MSRPMLLFVLRLFVQKIAQLSAGLICGPILAEFFDNFPNQSPVLTSDYLGSPCATTDRSVTLDKF